jgi:hypothetical protein
VNLYPIPNCPAGCAGSNPTALSNCRFAGGVLFAYYAPLQAANCFFDVCTVQGWSAPNSKFINCTFRRGEFDPYLGNQFGSYYITNCLFEETHIDQNTNVFGNYNAYETNYTRLAPTGTNDYILTSPMTYYGGTFGAYYQSQTNLVDRGSTGATNLGLYHFTAQSSENKETNTIVDIGAHYAAGDKKVRFLGTDTSTHGGWSGSLGADGKNVIGDSSSYPSYATVTPLGTTTFTWASSTSDTRALQKLSNTSDRIAAGWYAWNSMDINIMQTGGSAHQMAIYCLDWDTSIRTERIDIMELNCTGQP